jgi:hypothetical protein
MQKQLSLRLFQEEEAAEAELYLRLERRGRLPDPFSADFGE